MWSFLFLNSLAHLLREMHRKREKKRMPCAKYLLPISAHLNLVPVEMERTMDRLASLFLWPRFASFAAVATKQLGDSPIKEGCLVQMFFFFLPICSPLIFTQGQFNAEVKGTRRCVGVFLFFPLLAAWFSCLFASLFKV